MRGWPARNEGASGVRWWPARSHVRGSCFSAWGWATLISNVVVALVVGHDRVHMAVVYELERRRKQNAPEAPKKRTHGRQQKA